MNGTRRWGVPAAALTFLILFGPSAPAQEASKPKEAARRPDIYDTNADARAQVNTALASARRDHSRVLVMIGGNWCGWCHKLHDLFRTDPEIAQLLRNEYQLVMVDTQAKNSDALMSEWKVDHAKGVPYLVVLDETGTVVTRQETGSLEEGDHHDPAKVKGFLAEHVAEPVAARAVLDAALQRATSEEKRVFLHFGAPWCGWCHQLDSYLARPEVAAIIARDYIDLKIDTQRMTGGQDLLMEYCKNPGGIPWYVVLDSKGVALATSDGPKGNTGYPLEPHEIAHFIGVIKQTSRHIEPTQVEELEAALKEAAGRIKADLGSRRAARE
jgi:thiol:disulfide interchange protein